MRVQLNLAFIKSTDSIISAAYVAVSRAREGAAIYTDSRANLTEALGLRDGAQIEAIDEVRWEAEVAMALG